MSRDLSPFHMGRCNEPIPLYEGPAVLRLEGEELAGEVVANIRWLPRPRTDIELHMRCLPDNLGILQRSEYRGTLHFPNLQMSLDVFGRGFALGPALNIRLEPADDLTVDSGQLEADAIQFQILNLTWFHLSPGAEPVDALLSERWRCEIYPEQRISDLVKQLDEDGGYALTYWCSLTRRDGASIDRATSREMLHALAYFFAFIQGAWAPPLFASGTADSTVCWREWYHRYHQRWQSHFPSWFDQTSAECMPQLFPGFMARWESKEWQDTLRSAIYWYVQCNRDGFGIDGALILAQAALERLAWTYVVEDRGLVSAAAFKKLPADDQLRLFLTSVGIPVELTEHSPELRRHAKEHNWADGAKAIVEVRNALIHGSPDGRRKHFGGGKNEVLVEAWHLAVYLVELAVLRVCDYTGVHASRLDLPQMLGKVKTVPWATANR